MATKTAKPEQGDEPATGVRVPPEVRGDYTGTDPEAERVVATTADPVEVRPTTMTTLGEVSRATAPGFDAGGTPVIPSGPPPDRIAEIGGYPRTYEEAVLLEQYRDGEVDRHGRPIAGNDRS